MKKIAILTMAVLAFVTISCKNTKTAGPTPEEIQAQKVALADSVLAQIDAMADEYFDSNANSFRFDIFKLTEEEKMVKPDYLLEPSFANTLVTKSQKVNALAFYLADMPVRKLYDMPMEEAKEVIAKLAIELNHPLDADYALDFEMPLSEKIKKEYEACKERGDLAYFWQFQYAIIVETSFLFAQNPELFFSRINEEQWQNYRNKYTAACRAIEELAQYDEEMANLINFIETHKATSSKDEFIRSNATIESVIQFRIANKDKFIAKRNALLQ